MLFPGMYYLRTKPAAQAIKFTVDNRSKQPQPAVSSGSPDNIEAVAGDSSSIDGENQTVEGVSATNPSDSDNSPGGDDEGDSPVKSTYTLPTKSDGDGCLSCSG